MLSLLTSLSQWLTAVALEARQLVKLRDRWLKPPEGTVKLTKSSSIDPQDPGLEPAVNPPCWGSETAVSLNLTIPVVVIHGSVGREEYSRPRGSDQYVQLDMLAGMSSAAL